MHERGMNRMDEQTEQHPIRLLLLDDHGLFRASLSHFLASEPGFEIAGECGTTAEALEVLNGSNVDMVLLDLDLGSERGNEFILAARRADYHGRFLLIAGAADARSAAIALKLGASGIFLKSEAPERLVHAIKLVANGELWVDAKVIQMLAEQLVEGDHGSSGIQEGRERDVLFGILGGLTNKKIGANMGLSESSIKNIVQRLFGKAGVKTRSQLVRVALEGSWATSRPAIENQPKVKKAALVGHAKANHARRPTATNLSSN
jgi:two-component system, NarL family, nitrate/nitrite response regulator NarL